MYFHKNSILTYMKCTEATIESVQGKTEVRILQPHCYYFAVLGCDSAVLGLSACHFCPDSDPTVSNSDVLLPVSSLTHSLFHARTSATMSGRQTRSKTKYDQPAAAAPKAASTSKRKRGEDETFMNREQLMELRKVQAERIEAGKMKLLGMDIKQNMGVRMDGSAFE